MPQINLTAKLQAYTRAPFYGDYIRNPESITADYDKDTAYVFKNGNWVSLEEISSDIGLSIDALKQELEKIESELLDDIRTLNIDIKDSTLVFTNSAGVEKHLPLPASNVDAITIGKNAEGQLRLLDKPDNKTITVDNVIYEGDEFARKKISGDLKVIGLSIAENPTADLSADEIAIYNASYLSGYDLNKRLSAAEKNIKDLESFTQGTGGFLDPYNFGKSLSVLPEAEIRSELNNYAWDQLFNGIIRQIPDQTKIKNLYTGNIWVYVQEKDIWVNEGQDTIVTATNDGVLGAVTGVAYDPNNLNTKFKISIDTTDKGISMGTMTVNGLQDEFEKVVYVDSNDVGAVANSYARRTLNGTLVANPATLDNELITKGQLNDWISASTLSTNDINKLINDNFKIISNSKEV